MTLAVLMMTDRQRFHASPLDELSQPDPKVRKVRYRTHQQESEGEILHTLVRTYLRPYFIGRADYTFLSLTRTRE